MSDLGGVFYGLVSNRGGALEEVFPTEYTEISYTDHGQEEGNLLLRRGAESTQYWIGPNGNLVD